VTTDAEPGPALTRARTLQQSTREELVRADAKATTLLSAVGIVVAAVVGGAIAGIRRGQAVRREVAAPVALASTSADVQRRFRIDFVQHPPGEAAVAAAAVSPPGDCASELT
jgi:hypothetical protein